MKGPLFLFGGGSRDAALVRTYHPFVRAASARGAPRIAVVVTEEEGLDHAKAQARWRGPFKTLGLRPEAVEVLFVSHEAPLTAARLAESGATAVYLAGGRAPDCAQALLAERSWCAHVERHELPCAGFAAGAALMPARAIVGGWLSAEAHRDVVICPRDAAEQTDYLDVRDGIGWLPFTVESHGAQAGTLARLLHAVRCGAVDSGWAIDEDTALQVEGDVLTVVGMNTAWRVRRDEAHGLHVDAFAPGTAKGRGEW